MSNLCCTVYGVMCFVWQCNVLCSHLYYLCPKLIFFCIYVLIIRRVSQLRPRCNPIPGKVTQRLAPTGSRAGDPTSPPVVTTAGSLFWSGSLYVLGGSIDSVYCVFQVVYKLSVQNPNHTLQTLRQST